MGLSKLTVSLILLFSGMLMPFVYLSMYTFYRKCVEHFSYKRGNEYPTFLSEREILHLTGNKSRVATFSLSEDDFSNLMVAELRKQEKAIKVFYWATLSTFVFCMLTSVICLGSYCTEGIDNLDSQIVELEKIVK